MATRGARTAERAHAAHWRARCSRQRRPGSQSPRGGVSAGACRVGLDRGRERANRLPLGRGRSGSRKKIRSRIGPDVILAEGSPVGPLLQSTARNIPIVFTNVVDPVGSGFVASMSHPGGNATGFTQFEYRLSGKWLELLREVAPNVTRVAVIRDPRLGGGIGQFAVIQAMAPEAVELVPINAGSSAEIERAMSAFARSPNGGLIVTSGSTAFDRDIITSLAARHRLLAVYPFRYWAVAGGLISYGPNSIEPSQRAAGYIDRILRGEKPSDLPVQAPTRYELIVNLKTARGLSLTVPPQLLSRADEVIE